MGNFYMALSHKDWELPNSWIWLAETDIDRGLDFSRRRSQAECELVQTSYIKRIELFLFLPYNKHLITELSRSVW